MTLLKERERSDDNDARAFLLINTAEERALKRSTSFPNRLKFCHQRNPLREISQPLTSLL